METTNQSVLLNNTSSKEVSSLNEGKKESINSAKLSADTALRDKNMNQGIIKSFSGIFGFLLLFNAISNFMKDIKGKPQSTWDYLRIVFDFTVSGIMIGYTFNKTLWGIILGFSAGLFLVIFKFIKLKSKN